MGTWASNPDTNRVEQSSSSETLPKSEGEAGVSDLALTLVFDSPLCRDLPLTSPLHGPALDCPWHGPALARGSMHDCDDTLRIFEKPLSSCHHVTLHYPAVIMSPLRCPAIITGISFGHCNRECVEG